MKRIISVGAVAIALAVGIWAAVEHAGSSVTPAKLFPDGALLYLEAKDFHGLLDGWNGSKEKRTWLKGDNYAAFSRSRLFGRLSQAQDEFSTAATIPTDANMLTAVAGGQSALAIYNIGNLEFLYVTRMDQAQVEMTPLWRVRDKFEQRTEGNAQFYVHQDTQSNRAVAFAAREGWLVLGTRPDLVAGVLDRLQGTSAHSLPDESWYADALKQSKGPVDDLRMVINLEKVVPSPYFRSYWVQQNITEMKQYRASLSDLHRTKQEYREDRVLLRKAGASSAASGDVRALLAIAPADAAFSSAKASPDPDEVLASLRENVLDLKPEITQRVWTAPTTPSLTNAGYASDLEERIDVAPVIVAQSDPYQALHALLASNPPTVIMGTFASGIMKDDVFASIDRAIVIESSNPWNADPLKNAIVAAIRPTLTTSQLGVEWIGKTAAAGSYYALDGQVSMFLAVRDRRFFLATSEALMQRLLAKSLEETKPAVNGVTYAAVFQHAPQEQSNFRKIVNRLDSAGTGGRPLDPPSDGSATETESNLGRPPAFFSGNIASLSRTFADVERESIEERDQGESVTQTVVYKWK